MTAAVGAALRIATEQDVDVTAGQLRAVLRDTAKTLRTIQQDAAWRTVAVSSGHVAAFTAGWVQAIALLEKSAEEGLPPEALSLDSRVESTTTPEAGRCYTWTVPGFDPLHVRVEKVADDGSWADVVVTQRLGGQWQKRQPLGELVLVPTDLDVDAFLAGGQ